VPGQAIRDTGRCNLWNTTIKGKSYAKSVKVGPELKKYVDEINNHRSFLKLCEQLVEVNERICDLRPVPQVKDDQELAELKKKITQAVYGEIQREIDRIVTSYCNQKNPPPNKAVTLTANLHLPKNPKASDIRTILSGRSRAREGCRGIHTS